MKVLTLLHLPPPTHGAALVGEQVSKCLYKSEDINHESIPLNFVSNINDIGKPSWYKIKMVFVIFFKILYKLILFKPDVIYFTLSLHGFALLRDAIFVVLLKIFRSRIVYHLHTIGVRENEHKLYFDFLYRFIFSNTEVICLSEYSKSDLSTYMHLFDKVYVVSNASPVNEVIYSKNIKNYSSHFSKGYNFLYLSNLIESKGYMIALNLAKDMKLAGKVDFKFNFAGSWGSLLDESQFTDFVINYQLQNHVEYHGLISGEKKNSFLFYSDFLVFPSFYPKESFPLVILEALQNNLFILSSFHASIPCMVDSSSSYLISQGENYPVDKLLEIIGSYSKANNVSRQFYLENFSLKIFESNLIKVLKNA